MFESNALLERSQPSLLIMKSTLMLPAAFFLFTLTLFPGLCVVKADEQGLNTKGLHLLFPTTTAQATIDSEPSSTQRCFALTTEDDVTVEYGQACIDTTDKDYNGVFGSLEFTIQLAGSESWILETQVWVGKEGSYHTTEQDEPMTEEILSSVKTYQSSDRRQRVADRLSLGDLLHPLCNANLIETTKVQVLVSATIISLDGEIKQAKAWTLLSVGSFASESEATSFCHKKDHSTTTLIDEPATEDVPLSFLEEPWIGMYQSLLEIYARTDNHGSSHFGDLVLF